MVDITQRSFIAGELSPALYARADLAKYTTGVAKLTNYTVRAQGGAYNRPGLRYVGEVANSSKFHRLIPFAFSTTQTYVLEFGEQTLRVIKDGAYVVESPTTITGATQANPVEITDVGHPYSTGDKIYIASVGGMTELNGKFYTITSTGANTYTLDGVDGTGYTLYTTGGTAERVYTLATPWVEADLPYLKYTQSADVLTVTRHGYDPRNITRTAHDSWSIAAESFASTVTVPTGLGTAAVGTGAGSYNKTYRYVVTAFDAEGIESLPSAETSITTPSLSTTAGVKITWTPVAGASKYYIYKDPSDNSGVYGFIGETVNAEFTDFNIGPDTSASPPEDNEPFLGANDKPGVAGYYQQRKLYGDTVNQPQTMFATQTGIFDSLRSSTPTKASDAIEFTINSRQVNRIQHFVPMNELIILTTGGEWKVSEGADYVMTPATVGARQQSTIGASDVTPIIIGGVAIFVQEEGSKIYNLHADSTISIDGTQNLKEADLTILSDHLFRGYTITDISHAKEPDGIVWCVRSDGKLLGLTYQLEHQVQGWHVHETDGEFESVATISESGRSVTYFIVKRTINGQTRRYVEFLEAREEAVAEDCFYLDSGLSYSGPAVTSVSGLDHLEGETVVALIDAKVARGLVVTNGAVTLPYSGSKIHIGLPYVCDLETLDIDSAERTLQGRVKSVANVALKVFQSRGGFIGPDFDNLLEIPPRRDSDGYDPIPLRSFTQEINVQPTWSEGGRVAIRQDAPLPMAILTITPSLDVGG